MADRTYTLTFVCENCDIEFNKNFPFGEDVEVSWSGCWRGSNLIKCPNCGSSKIGKKWD